MELMYKTNYNSSGANTAKISDSLATLKHKKVNTPNMSFFGSNRGVIGNASYQEHAYDLYEYGRIIDTEAFVAVAFKKKRALILKQGYNITSKNKENLKYIKRRISEIEYVSRMPFRKLLKEISYNLVAFHNVYIAKARNEQASSGKPVTYFGKKTLDPIAALFCLAPETIEVKPAYGGTDRIEKYKQTLGQGSEREYLPENIIHIYTNKRTGFLMGTPPLEGVKEDILALRRIEESIETLIYKNLFPIIHIAIGSEKAPARVLPNGVSEVAAATQMLKDIEDDGGLVTSERVKVQAIGSESMALRVEPYLKHFKHRVYAGLGMSGMDFGEGENTGRSTGEVLSASLSDSVIDYQTEIEDAVTRYIFDELLVESGKYYGTFEIEDEDRVFLELRHRSQGDQISYESHILNMAQSDLITVSEARASIGKEAFSEEEREDTFGYYKSKLRQEESKAQAVEREKNKVPSEKPDPVKNTVKNIVKPKNQHTKDSIAEELTEMFESGSQENRILMKGFRIISDYGIRRLTNGLFDSAEIQDEDLFDKIRTELVNIVDNFHENNNKTNKIRPLLLKLVDKVDEYVDNINTTNLN